MKALTLSLLLLALTQVAGAQAAQDLQTISLQVDGIERTALVHFPANAPEKLTPLVFVFHGHGGNSRAAANKFETNRLWPEAISVYPQGLNTPGALTDPDGLRSGWQKMSGDQADRDLHFFDALLANVQKDHPVDPKRIYCTGHSNGAGFTYLLWLTRAKLFAAVAPCSGAARYVTELTPKPALISGGKNDELVKFEWQEKMIEAVRAINGCDPSGQPWQGAGTLYPSKNGTPLVTYLYSGGHMMDEAEPGLIVKFFREHP